ncbi:uncharacterized protein LOC132182347 isoform X4 [Corylus avellana]|uniref:uncharacterized protein LOC132182347 isoform X4 n=1 Tax=Corylus avellana TaxID=13451 RepID=UPI00286A95FC|nr:uncharacterized protein LOC132182347 isoform X4 [Corylus avellana]
MEVSAGVAASAAVRLPMSQPPSSSSSASNRKEWRAISEHRNAGDEAFSDAQELERSKLGQSDERTIYEGREPLDVDFCSITVDGSLDEDLLPQRLHSVTRQREELQRTEIELTAQMIARSEIMGMQSNFDAQIKEHANAAAKLQEQLHEREQAIRELERKMEEKDRELHAIKLDNEAAWAKEDLLREQNQELASFRRERDHSEAERAQHIKQMRDIQEHIQEKERQLIELQEQHRVAQEAILYKDEQLREAQAWITRVQEMDALQSTTNHSLQAELRERTEQYNQLWHGCQRQFAEMERLHLHTIQQLHLELADARERSGTYNGESRLSQTNSSDVSQFVQSNGNQLDGNRGGTSGGNSGALPNGSSDNVSSFASTDNASTQTEHVPVVPIAPSSLLAMPTYLPSGQVTALHPYVMHQQGVPHSVPSHGPPSHVGHFHSIPAMGSLQQWQNQQSVSEGSQISTQNEIQPSQVDQNPMRSEANYNYEISVNGLALRQDYLDVHISQGAKTDSGIMSSTGEAQVLESIDRGYLVTPQTDLSLQQISSQFRDALRLDTLDQKSENKAQEPSVLTSTNHGLEGQVSTAEQLSSAANPSSSDASIQSVNLSETAVNNATGAGLSESFVSTRQENTLTVGKTSEPALLDERSLLACIVRTTAGGRIRISSTLPNRLGKMLAPLHWHDYKKKYGKLDEFVVGHPELFVIEGDYIQLREGAQEMIAAEAALAKVAAAAKASSPYTSFVPSMAVTPVAQPHRLKKVPSIESKTLHNDKTALKEYAVISPSTSSDEPPQFSAMPNQQPNGVGFGLPRGLSNIKILSKSKDPREMNGPESRPMQSAFLTVGNGSNLNRSSLSNTQSTGSANGRTNLNFVGKQQGRMSGAAFTSRR